MSNLTVIEQKEVLGKDFKIYGDVDQPLFLAKDVAEWIDYDLSSINKLVNMVDENERVRKIAPTLGGEQEMWFLTEDGLYEVLMQSRKPIAKEFKKQVKEILRTIRKTGSYTAKPVCIEDAIIASMQQHKALRLEMEAQKMLLNSQQETLAIHSAKINQIAAKIETSPTDYFSIAGYASLRGIKIDVNKANLLGRKAAKYSRDTEIDIGRVNDPRFGQVNTYHLDVLKEIFDTLEVSA